MQLGAVLLAALPAASADVGLACMDHGRARVPCHDELRLARADKLLLSLVGHSCYSLAVAAPQPLEVYLYDGEGGLQAANSSEADAIAALTSTEQALVSLDPHLCRGTQTCSQVREGLSPSTIYSLVIARSRGGDTDSDKELSVLLDLQHCDPLSSWHYFGLVMVGMLGFTSVLLLLCLIGEFVLGLRSVTNLRKSVDKIRFIELAQLDPVVKAMDATNRGDLEEDEDDATVLISESESEDSSPRPAVESENDDCRLLTTGEARDVDQA